MKTIATLCLLLFVSPIFYAQSVGVVTGPDDSKQQAKELSQEINGLSSQIESLKKATPPDGELPINIYKAHIQELEVKKRWKEKQMSVLRAENNKTDAAVSGLRDEEDALKDRYRSVMERRMDLEKEFRAQKAEKADETLGASLKLQMRMDEVRSKIDAKKQAYKLEASSDEPDSERMAQIEGEIEALYRQLEELDAR